LRRELEATEDLVIRLGKILSETALALKGPPPPLTRHSTHDLAEVARATVSQLDAMRKTAQEWWDLSELRREDDLRLRASVRAEHAALRAQLDEALADRERLLRLVEGSNANASQSTEERAREEAQGIRLRDEVRSLRARLDASERDAARYLSDYESEVAETERLTSLLSEAEQAHAALLDSADEAMRAGLEECERLRAEVGTLDDTVRTLEDDREETRRRVRVALGAIGVPGVADCADPLAALDATVTEVVAEAVDTSRALREGAAKEVDAHNALVGRLVKAWDECDALRRERDRLLKREEHFASVLRVTDRGRYRADWDSAIRRVVAERDALRSDVARLTAERAETVSSYGSTINDLRVALSGLDAEFQRAENERLALRAIAAGRNVLPTEAEALAHDENHGRWLVVSSDGQGTTMVDVCGLSAARLDPSRVLRVYALDAYHCLCAWPVVEVPRG
jgi:chromosome segregation ATPase